MERSSGFHDRETYCWSKDDQCRKNISRSIHRHSNPVRTVLVRGGHLGLDGARVKQLQQGAILDHLVVPSATLDSELHPCNKDNR